MTVNFASNVNKRRERKRITCTLDWRSIKKWI